LLIVQFFELSNWFFYNWNIVLGLSGKILFKIRPFCYFCHFGNKIFLFSMLFYKSTDTQQFILSRHIFFNTRREKYFSTLVSSNQFFNHKIYDDKVFLKRNSFTFFSKSFGIDESGNPEAFLLAEQYVYNLCFKQSKTH